MKISSIAAMADNRTIGINGGLPWSIPEDTKFFREKTKGSAIIMGRKTYESMGKTLPKRLNVIITRQTDYKVDGAHVFSNIDDALEFCSSKTNEWGDEVFVIGGGEIYKQTMGQVDCIYLTHIYKDFEGDAQFPVIPEDQFELVKKEDHTGPVDFSFLVYKRKSDRSSN